MPLGLCLVPMTCRKWRFNFALHAGPAKLWRHNGLIYLRYVTIALVSTIFHCSNRDVTLVSGSLATLHPRVPIQSATSCDKIFYALDLFQNKTISFMKGCNEDENQSPIFSLDSTGGTVLDWGWGELTMLYCYQLELPSSCWVHYCTLACSQGSAAAVSTVLNSC